MLNLINRKSKIERLYDKYFQLLERAREISDTNRRKSDELFAKSNKILKEIQQTQQIPWLSIN
ncbi:MAG: Lacal_2735 family protein [Bacteroidales bacterium]|nr:Lacal_2735 family protein [Bacteroidales bacterium]